MSSKFVVLAVAITSALLSAGNIAIATTGYYSVDKIDGVWWFVDPEGRTFYSLGVSDIGPGPARDTYDPKRPCYAAFRHHDSTEKWAEDTLQRLREWNFNTIGSWGHPLLARGPMPYAYVLHLGGGDYVPWCDLFHEQFEKQIDRLCQTLVAPRAADRNLLGWYSDNELKWYPDAMFRFQLAQPPTSATRSKLIELLSLHYSRDYSKLLRDFDVTKASSFDDLNRGGDLRLRKDGNGRKVVTEFAALVAERYYKVVHDSIRRYDENHLILGDRYPWHCPEVVAKAAAPYVDVISTNLDWPEAADGYLPCGYLSNLHRITGRPVLVTECYVAARENHSGNKNTIGTFLTVDTQLNRAVAASNRLQLLAKQPYVVGSHWFRFADEPPNGRPGDGEDYNFGLVDIENRPYQELVAAIGAANRRIPALHGKSVEASAQRPGPIETPMLRTTAGELHNTLSQAASMTPHPAPLPLYDMLAAWNEGSLFLATMVCHVSEREMYPADAGIEEHELELTIESEALKVPIRVKFGGSQGASADDPSVECWLSSGGLRHTLVLGLPALLLGSNHLQSGHMLNFRFTLNDLLAGESSTWETSCKLVAESKVEH